MRTGTTLQPGKRGTRKLCEQYGASLVCVRYRYDAEHGRRLKTVEIIVDESPWTPPPPPPARMVAVFVAFEETDLRRRVKAAGGIWDPDRRVWQIADYVALQLGLKERIVN